MADWSKLPQELLLMIAVRLFSVVELLRFRSICTSWRSSVSVADMKRFPSRPLIQLNPLLVTLSTTNEGVEQISGLDRSSFLSRASFIRVSSSSSSKGWLIKYGKVPLINPLSRFRYHQWYGSIDLFTCKVSEIQASYIVKDQRTKNEDFGFKRVILDGKNRLLGVGCDGKIRYWNGEIWTRVKDQTAKFCDIIVHRGLTYALDAKGNIWWITSSLSIYRVIHCRNEYTMTVGFKVYKMDEDSVKWVQVKSLGDNALVIATDTCFSLLADEFCGCLPNAIYFSDNERYEIKVFNLDDVSITRMSENSESCVQMFSFLSLHFV